jgi:UDP-arabinose 4-epimerase
MKDASRLTVLVIGGAGYIGSHACKALARAGYLPVTYDNFVSGHEWAVKWGPLEHGDILDRAGLDRAIFKYRPNAVMHFAAFASVRESLADPGKYYRNNVAGSLTLLEAMRDHNINGLVFSSTCATYGIPETLPVREDAPQRPVNPYGASKLMVERMLQDFGAAHGLRSIALRYFNAAGADLDNEIGEVHDPETHLIPLVLDAASGRVENVTVFGSDYDTADGTCIRDYVHVADLAAAHVKALEALQSGVGGRAYNLGSGIGFSVRQVIEVAADVTGLGIPTVMGPRRPGDPAVLVSDARSACEELGWSPRMTDLARMIGTAWAWHQKQASPGINAKQRQSASVAS